MNWLWKWLGRWNSRSYHICEEFTQWEEKRWICSRPATSREAVVGLRVIQFLKRFQERRCTLCGKIEQRELKTGSEEYQ